MEPLVQKEDLAACSRPSPSDDFYLVESAAAGSSEARRRVIDRVFERVRKTLTFISNREEDVDDLTQNALMEVLRSLHTYRGESTLPQWADRIALRTAAKSFEKRARRSALFSKMVEADSLGPSPIDEAIPEYGQVLHRFRVLLENLSDNNRLSLILHHIKGYSVAEIAELAGCSPFTIKGRLRRGRRLLKRGVLGDPVLAEWVAHELGWREP